MTDKQIYQKWLSATKDHRYFRPKRWEVMKQVIIDHKVKSVLEFGIGVSTLLFQNLGLKVTSYETDPEYIKFVEKLGVKGQIFYWDNTTLAIPGHYDLAFVDGILPREPQLILAKSVSNLIAIDDYAGREENLLKKYLTNFKRIDDRNTLLAIFKIV